MPDLIPDRLSWAPNRRCHDDWIQASPFDFCGELGSEYQVTHYTRQATGRAFGPLNLAQTLSFCKKLDQALVSSRTKGYELSAPTDEGARCNACVLVGAYLILSCKWSTARVADVMGETEAKRKFPCSWARVDRPERERMMEVGDCWAGLELAQKQGWVAGELLDDDEDGTASYWIETYLRMSSTYDAAWLVPGSILISADPMTTALDPNPITFTDVFPVSVPPVSPSALPGTPEIIPLHDTTQRLSAVPEIKRSSTGGLQVNTVSYMSPCKLPLEDEVLCSSPSAASLTSKDSVNTVCKEYGSLFRGTYECDVHTEKPKAFVTFLQDCHVALIIRTNFSNEPGMIKAYEGSQMSCHGIEHAEVNVDDRREGLPNTSSINRALDATADYMHDADHAVLVHCKGGFGRSVIMACFIVIDRLDVPGAALLGWARLCRPGAITTPAQEQLLRSLRGRADLHRVMKLSSESTACTCALQ